MNAPQGFSSYSSHSRNYSANASLAPKDWLSLDASYMKLHLDTAGGIAFFAGAPGPPCRPAFRIYRSNVHAGNLGARFAITKRADLYVGYTITKDTGDGRSTATDGATDPTAALFAGCRRSR